MKALIIKRYEIFFADLNPTIGGEIQKIRPVIIISQDESNFSITVGKPHVSKSLDSGFRRNDVLHLGNPLRHSGGSRNPECSACTY